MSRARIDVAGAMGVLFAAAGIFACGSGPGFETGTDVTEIYASRSPSPAPPHGAGAAARDTLPPPPGVMSGTPRAPYVLEGDVVLPEGELLERMAEARVICFGELHPNPEHHVAQSRALRGLAVRAAAEGRRLALGFEMFQWPYQAALDAFVMGQIDEAELLSDTEYQARWGWPFSLYRPLLETARQFGLPALALNAPTELTRKIARMGIASLDASEREQLPELDLENAAHSCYFSNLGRVGPCPPIREPSDIYTAQVVWDETMADTSASWLSDAGDDAQLIVFAGMGHCQESAIPERITRRTGIEVLNVMPLEPAELRELDAAPDMFDLIMVIEPEPPPSP